MKARIIYQSDSGNVIACDDNPNYYIEAPVNSIALTRRGDVYRKFNVAGADGWVLICGEGGPRVGAFLDAANFATGAAGSDVPATPPPQDLNIPLEGANSTLGQGSEPTLRESV